MKTIHLIRHAKSSWESEKLSDVERPLNDRGRESCRLMAPAIAKAGCDFKNVFCSVATRAQQTIRGISEALPEAGISWELDPRLYTFTSGDILDWLMELEDDLDEVVLVGHNPAFTGVCNILGSQPIDNLPTCGYVRLQVPKTKWRNIEGVSGTTEILITPRDLSS